MFQFNIATYLATLLSIFIISSGGGCFGGQESEEEKSGDVSSGSHAGFKTKKKLQGLLPAEITSSAPLSADASKVKNLVFAFANGLTSSHECFNSLINSLKKVYPNAHMLPLESVERDNTLQWRIIEQAKKTYEEFVNFLKGKNISQENTYTVWIGHSQGGLRVHSIYDQFMKQNKNVAIIDLAAPLEGAPIIDNLPAIKQVLNVLDSLIASLNMDIPIPKFVSLLPSWSKEVNNPNQSPRGVADLKPKSEFLNKLKGMLRTAKIPILAIGAVSTLHDWLSSLGASSDLLGLIDTTSLPQEVNTRLFPLITGKKSGTQEHDLILPLDSQLARNVPNKGNNFKTVIINGVSHDTILNDKRMDKAITDFIAEVVPKETLNAAKQSKVTEKAA